MVCLGDRLVMEDRYVGLDSRIEYIIDKARRNGIRKKPIPIILEKKKTLNVLWMRSESSNRYDGGPADG